MKTETYTLPSFWASLLINGDATGYEESELAEINGWLDFHPELGPCLACSDEEEFRWRNDANNLGTTVLDFIFPVLS